MSVKKDIVLLIQGQTKEFSAKELSMKSFPHPKGYPMLVIDLNDKLYELQSTQPRKYSSWFINQRVSSSQLLYTASVFDPRFLCLPFLEKSAAKFSPLDQIVFMDGNYSRFPFSRASSWKMHEICDVNDKLGDDMILYRYNEVKVVEWLKAKVAAVAGVIRDQRIAKSKAHNTTFASSFNVSKQTTGVGSANTAASSSSADEPTREDLITALEIVSDYLTPSCTEKLLKAHNMDSSALSASKSAAATANLKRKADWEQELELEKETLAYSSAASKVSNNPTSSTGVTGSFGANNSANKSAVGSKSTVAKASVKANQIASKGTKSIQSFFGGKT